MVLSNYGMIVESELQKIEYYHKRIKVNTWVIMPNHIHIIISIENTDYDNGVSQISDRIDFDFAVDEIHEFHLQQNQNQQPSIQPDDAIKQYRKRRRNMLIPKILGKFKQQTSKQMNILQNTAGSKNWQRDYHDHIIRNKSEYCIIQNYIINNPKNWVEDTFYSD